MKKLGELTAELQTLSNEGQAEDNCLIEILDAVYAIDGIKVYEMPSGKKYCVIKARSCNE